MLCVKFGWNWPSGSGKDFFFVNIFLLFWNYLPLERSVALRLRKHEFLSPRDVLCQVWLRIGQAVMENFLKSFVNIFSLFRHYFPLEKGLALYLKTLNPHHPRMLCPVCWNWLCCSGEEDENVKSLQTDGRRSEKAHIRNVM